MASEAMWTPRVSMENSLIPDVSSKVLTEGQWDEIQRNQHWHQLELYLETEVAKIAADRRMLEEEKTQMRTEAAIERERLKMQFLIQRGETPLELHEQHFARKERRAARREQNLRAKGWDRE